MSKPDDSPDELTSQHKFFVGMYRGFFPGEAQAIAAAKLPSGITARGQFESVDGSKVLTFKSPPGTTDTKGLEVLILERTIAGSVRLWLSTSDLARSTRKEADDDVENFKEIGGGSFRVFERK